MKVRALKTTHGDYGLLPRGNVAEVDEHTGKELIAQGYAVEELSVEHQVAAPQRSEAANDNDPFVVRPTGGQTGADVPPSSSPADQAQPELISDAQEGEPNSSPSTKDTDSARGQTSSTPATTTGGRRGKGRPRSRG